MRTRISLFFLVALMAGLAACAGNRTVVESDLGMSDAPDWVNEGSQALDDQDGRYFHGIGSAPKMGDQSLQIGTADDRARAEVARVLSSYMNVVSQNYSAASGGEGDTYNENSASRQIENITRLNMSGVRIIAHWKNPKNGAIYSLAELDMKRVKDVVAKVGDMNAGFQDYMLKHGDRIFDEFSKESN